MFSLSFPTTNAAFTPDATHEAARILRAIAEQLESGVTGAAVLDGNGNALGAWELSDHLYPPAGALDAARSLAEDAGAAAGTAAAAWVLDGNTDDDVLAARLAQLRDCDAAADEWMPAPDLTGQFAGAPTAEDVARDALEAAGVDVESIGEDQRAEVRDQLAEAWEDAFTTAAAAEAERLLVLQLDGPEPIERPGVDY